MIREIINFTEQLIEDIPDIMQWNLQPSIGLHIIVEIDNSGQLINFPGEKGYHWDYYDGKNMSSFLSSIIEYEQYGVRIGTNMNKVFDKKKQITSCSPFMISFKKEKLSNSKLEGVGWNKILNLLEYYFNKSIDECLDKEDETIIQNVNTFKLALSQILPQLENIREIGSGDSMFQIMKPTSFVNIYFKNVRIENYKKSHIRYLQKNLFNKNDYNVDINGKIYGLSDFYNGLNTKKPFLEHKSASFFKGISSRINGDDATLLNNFLLLLNRKVLPNPLPIFIDKEEIAIGEKILKLFKDDGKLSYSELIKRTFEKENIVNLKNYYLLLFVKGEIVDFDFVPLFRYSLPKNTIIENTQQVGVMNDGVFVTLPKEIIKTIFDFERIIVRDIFNNSLVKIDENKNTFTTSYFGDIRPDYVKGGNMMYQLIMKYRKAFYDYIYKSKTNAISQLMFDDLMWQSILTNIRTEKVEGKFFGTSPYIKRKLNIWFSLSNFFNNNINTEIMASKVTELTQTMHKVAKGEAMLESNEEFAFGAGQIVSYLVDKSAASNKTYALLEPYLQKVKSEQLQDAIAQSIAVYKHEIPTYKGKFQSLASNVLTYDGDIDVKPLLKYFLAGCFSQNEIYRKENNN